MYRGLWGEKGKVKSLKKKRYSVIVPDADGDKAISALYKSQLNKVAVIQENEQSPIFVCTPTILRFFSPNCSYLFSPDSH